MTPDADLAVALKELKLAIEVFHSNPRSVDNAVAVVQALERYMPDSSSPFYSHFVQARDGLIRDMIGLFPDTFPMSRVFH